MDERLEMSIEYPGGVTDNSAVVTPLGNDRFRLEEDPLSCLIAESPRDLRKLPNYGDVIEATYIAEDTLRFIRVVERARLKRFQVLISQDVAEAPALKRILSKVETLDGHWERVFGGVLTIYLPEDSEYDPSKELERMGGAGPERHQGVADALRAEPPGRSWPGWPTRILKQLWQGLR